MRTSIWLVRHGQTVLNKARRYQSVSDYSLTAYGQQQATALAYRLRRTPFHTAIVSPTRRARETAELVLAGRGVAMLDDARWAETNHGRWEGLTYREVRARFPDESVTRFADPLNGRTTGGESLAEVQARVLAGWHTLLGDYPGGRILVATHATPIQLIVCHLAEMSPTLHWRWRIDQGSVTAIDVYGSAAIVRTVNEVPRLHADQAE